ncbi:MAG: DUF6378 domain-containing protein [Ilumatobacteraceae bacterium]
MTTFFSECERLVNSNRQDDYGDPVENLERIASVVSSVLNKDISPREITLIMIAIKLCREGSGHKRDNLLDMACYAEILDRWEDRI